MSWACPSWPVEPACRYAPTRNAADHSLGIGKLHSIIIDRLRRKYGVEANIGAPQVAYRETITRPHTETYTHRKQTAVPSQSTEVKITFSRRERNGGVVFENSVVGGCGAAECMPRAVEKGIRMQADTGM